MECAVKNKGMMTALNEGMKTAKNIAGSKDRLLLVKTGMRCWFKGKKQSKQSNAAGSKEGKLIVLTYRLASDIRRTDPDDGMLMI